MVKIKTGELLTAYCNRKRIRKSGLARKAGIGYQSILKHFKSKTLSVNTLLKISTALEHNFLMDIAVQLPKNYTTDAPADTPADDEIEALKEKIKLLENKNQVLLEVIGAKG
ncbi:MAG: helix-turn-helix domain-containing protein [Bacteroidota bacterium]